MTKTYKNPAATATIIFERDGKLALVRRKHKPYRGMLAFPGGFLNCEQETLERTAQRESGEEMHLRVRQKDLYLLCVNSSPKRDPRGHVIDHVYVAKEFTGRGRADDDAEELLWIPIREVPRLAFDHYKDFKMYLEWRKTYGK